MPFSRRLRFLDIFMNVDESMPSIDRKSKFRMANIPIGRDVISANQRHRGEGDDERNHVTIKFS